MEVDNGASNVAVVTRVCLVGSSGNNEELKEQLKVSYIHSWIFSEIKQKIKA